MRRIRYGIGMSLDGYIADRHDGLGWMHAEPTYDQAAFFQSIDTVLMGRRSYDVARQQGGGAFPGFATYVISRTLRQEDAPDVTVLGDGAEDKVRALRAQDGKDIWLAGGGDLGGHLLGAGLVDAIELGIFPMLLGQGIPFVAHISQTIRLELRKTEAFPQGLVVLHYDVVR